MFERRREWALAFRVDSRVRGNQTNNFVETQFNILKDVVLQRTKEYNINGLLEKIVVDFNDHYKDKLLSVANGTFDSYYGDRFKVRNMILKRVGNISRNK